MSTIFARTLNSTRFASDLFLLSRRMRGLVAIASVGVAAVVIIGCGQSNGRLGISGAVTLDGAALDTGVITFFSRQGKLPSASAAIQDGSYSIPADKGLLPGSYLVAIDAANQLGVTARPDEQPMEIPVSRIPLRYNGETQLTAEVSAESDNRFEFSLESDNAPGRGKRAGG
jgi:hypothetical protein